MVARVPVKDEVGGSTPPAGANKLDTNSEFSIKERRIFCSTSRSRRLRVNTKD